MVRDTEFDQLLERILRAWEEGKGFPLFVSEGHWRQKLRAIQRSGYLSTVYSSVMSDLGDTVAVYGWALKERERKQSPSPYMCRPPETLSNLQGYRDQYRRRGQQDEDAQAQAPVL